jgi:hypothetical protein
MWQECQCKKRKSSAVVYDAFTSAITFHIKVVCFMSYDTITVP